MRMPDPFPSNLRAFALAFSVAFGLLTIAAPASAQATTESGAEGGQSVTISEPWIRYVIPARPAAGYLGLANGGDRNAALVGARSPACAMMHLHESVDGSMRSVDSLPVPAGGEAELEPGGYHLMCMKPDMAPGDTVPVTLTFADGHSVTAGFTVYDAGGKPE